MKKNWPRISVIIPAYNAEEYIEATLDSLFAQETPAYEVIIIDDGSTDATLDRIDQYTDRPELTVISTENKGPGPARNEGLRHATGDYVYQFDSDDLLDKRLLTTIVSAINARPAVELVLFSGNEFCHDDPTVLSPGNFVRSFSAADLSGDEVVARLATAGDVVPVTWLYVSKRSLWVDKQLSFKTLTNHEDNEIYLKLLLSAKSVVVLRDVLVYRRVRPTSLSNAPKTAKYAMGLFETAATLVDLYEHSAARPRATRRVIRKRAIRTAQRYLRTCRIIGCEANTRRMFAYAPIVRSPSLVMAVIGYICICRLNVRTYRRRCRGQ